MDNKDEPCKCGYGAFQIPGDDPFAPWCVLHDLDYENGTTIAEMIAADERFINGIFSEARKDWRLWPRAILYAGCVNLFGRFVMRKHLR